jgi:hypothetical protein
MKRRPISPFSLSFLDIMFCGFGAVVLLVLILNHDTVSARNAIFTDLRAEALMLEQEVLVGTKDLVEIRNSLTATERELVITQGESEQILQRIQELEIEIAQMVRETLASRQHSQQLQSDLKTLDEEQQRLGSAALDQREEGEDIRRFMGEGDRQYLTGLKLGGKRTLILIDASASMLDETLVNVIRRRHMSDALKRSAAKWQRALKTADWLISNLPANAAFQLYTFNTLATAALPESRGQWLSTSSRQDVEGVMSGLYTVIPEGGTSLYQAFAEARALSPRPDNILLVTDGLPTQGERRPATTTVSGKQRIKHFSNALGILPAGIPVNTVLLPMEGDAYAAAAYWRLAIDTRGSMITPARDWP